MGISPERTQEEYRRLPAVDALLRVPAVELLVAEYGLPRVTNTLRGLLDDARRAIGDGQPAPNAESWVPRLSDTLERLDAPSLRRVVNATGVIVHTNLGRAPLSKEAVAAVSAVASGYSNLEYELSAGRRGSRHDHARQLLCELSGAEDALVVNNNAAAVYLVLAGLCAGREVLVSRGQLVEIGGGFRIPDVLRQSGAQLVEVGTTNRTHNRDFSDAIRPDTAAIMRIHSSNFQQIGFVTEPSLADLAQIAHHHRNENPDAPVYLIDDLGSGTLLDTVQYGLAPEPMVQASIAAGADIITFSGDKLLGGPQAGIILGRQEQIAILRRHPMARAIRVGKMTLTALEATLRSYLRGRAAEEIPVWRMIAARQEELLHRVQTWRAHLGTDEQEGGPIPAVVWDGESAVGGGSLPGETLPTHLLAVPTERPDRLADQLRSWEHPVIGRVQHDHVLFDPRTVLPEDDSVVLAAIRHAWSKTVRHGD